MCVSECVCADRESERERGEGIGEGGGGRDLVSGEVDGGRSEVLLIGHVVLEARPHMLLTYQSLHMLHTLESLHIQPPCHH